ncbi:hypothetical protein SISNIDRAFT_294887 [Sistotremastrum niveocremeum HHB9708]|uniref:Uncharacterized protein n=2 Tax=Sistotremastraceae TaxID=3402574 RepID=A0A164NJB9_9AGAM|nr:hypothetical protein SISNIDRAFT_294887 [Sistotremastrum niveocremeum HHB9708]KZT41892.1 hypothetical protein SISSUDRAFT_176294 [Sistotremastrum suecicum HHB10207 ss-3]
MMDLTSNSTSMNGNSGPVYSATIPHQGSQFHSHPQTHYVMSSPRLATNAPISNLPFGIPAPSHPHPLTHQPHPQHHRINGDAVYTSDVSGSRIPNNNVHSGSGSGYHLSSSASASTATMGSMNGHIHHQGQGHGHGHGGSGLSGFTPANAGLAVGDHGQVSPVIMNSGMPMVMESGLGYMDHDDGVGVGAMAGMHTGNGIGGMNCQWGVKRETTVNPCSRIPYGGPQAF